MPNDKLIRWAQVVIAACLLAIVFIEYVLPLLATKVYGKEFQRLALECDHAMHNEMAIRDLATNGKLPHSLLISGAVELAVCHRYDKLQKRLLLFRVPEEQLSLLGLEALESERVPLSRMVDPHRMPRF